MYEKTCELMYKMISERIKFKRSSLEKRNSYIYPDDENMISAIANNRRNNKKNKYLIPSETSRSKEPKKYISTISSKLEFTSCTEFLWGNQYEIDAYSGELFYSLITEALEFEDKSTIQKVYNILTDYIPFAMSKFYFDFLMDYSDESYFLIDTKYHTDEACFFTSRTDAILRLYNQIENNFINLITDFFYNRKDTQKLDKAFSSFFTSKVLPIIEDTISENSIGNEARKIMVRNHKRLIELSNYELQASPEALGYHENEKDYYDRQIINDLVKAGSQYVDNLARIQKESEPPLNKQIFQNTWTPEMCI